MAFTDVKINYYQSMYRIRSRRFLVFAALIQIACMLSSAGAAQVIDSQIQAQVQEHFLAAQQAQKQGQFDTAANEYKAVLGLQPGLPEACMNLGLVYYAQAKFDESAKALAAAGKLKPGMGGVSLWLGIDYVKLNRPLEAIALLREAVHQNPSDKLGQSWLGTALWDAGQMEAALLQLGKASAMFPGDPDLLFARAEAYGKAAKQQTEQLREESAGTALSDRIYSDVYVGERDLTKAEGHLRRAIQRDPQSVDARLQLAEVLLKQAHMAEAQEQLEKAGALAPHSATALARSGELLLLTEEREEGLSRMGAALKIDPNEALDALGLPVEVGFDEADDRAEGTEVSSKCRAAVESLEADPTPSPLKEFAIAAMYARAGDKVAAMQAYEKIDPSGTSRSSPASLFAQAMMALHQRRYDDAEAAFLQWLAVHPEDKNARYELILARRHIYMEQVNRLLAVAPDSYHVHQLLGQAYADREEDEKALEEYLAVAAAQPRLPGVHFWLGHLYWKHGDAEHALTELTRELELDPGHAEANGELGAVLVAQGHAREAIPHLESAIHNKPDLWPAYPQLGRAYAIEKNYTRAEEVLKRALAHDADGNSHYQLGLVLRDEGKTAQATQVFAQVRTIKSENMIAPAPNDAAGLDENQ